MNSEIENLLGCSINTTKYKNKLPLPVYMAFREIEIADISGFRFAIIDISKEHGFTISAIRKQKQKYEEVLAMPVAFKIELDSTAMRNALVKQGIPFISLPGNIYLPFLGIVLQENYRKKLIRTDKMMPATQMVFLELLYNDSEEGILKSEAAEKLNLTKTSLTRATDQLSEMGLISQARHGTEIRIKRNHKAKKDYYYNAKGFLINPVQSIMVTKKEGGQEPFYYAGETALSKLTFLNAPEITVSAVYKKNKAIEKLTPADIRFEDINDCMSVQLWKYCPSHFAKDGCVDPVSLACSLAESDDERIDMCIDEMIERL